jgi:hypothetical protein
MLNNRNNFAFASPTAAWVLGSDGNLWLEQGPWGTVPPSRQQIDGNVQAFQPLGGDMALVLGMDNNLWLEQGPWGTVPPSRQQIDGNVKAFYTTQLGTITQIYVLGQDGNLWLEQAPWGNVPPSRQQVDGLVVDFFPISATEVYVLGSDGNLWLEQGPWGTVPPSRQQIDGNVQDFFAFTNLPAQVFVLGSDGNLWLEQGPWGTVPPSRQQIDGDVLAFQPLNTDEVYVLGQDRNLWFEQGPWGTVPPKREQVDGNVQAFVAWGGTNLLVEGTDANLWAEEPPWGSVPPTRQQVDGNVAIGIPTPPPPAPPQGAPVMSNNGTIATYSSGEITVPGGLPLSGNLSVVFTSAGDFTFNSHAHDAGFDGINYAIAAVILTPDGMAFTFSHSGYCQGTIDNPFGSPNRDDNYTQGGFNQEIVNEWANIPNSSMGWSLAGTDEATQWIEQEIPQLLGQLLQAAGKAAATAVIALV